MSNEEILRVQFAATQDRATWTRAMELYDDAVVLLAGEAMQAPGVYFGKEAVGRWFADWLTEFDDPTFDLREIHRGSDALAVYARHTARGRGSGIELAADLYYAYWFRAGKVIRAEVHMDRDTAWRAAGVTG